MTNYILDLSNDGIVLLAQYLYKTMTIEGLRMFYYHKRRNGKSLELSREYGVGAKEWRKALEAAIWQHAQDGFEYTRKNRAG